MADEVLFTSQTFTTSNQQDATYNMGTLIIPAVAGVVKGIRFLVDIAPTTTPSGTLWRWDSDTTGTQLATATFGTITGGATWNTVTFGSPVAVTAGQKLVAAVGPINNWQGTSNFFTTPLTNGNLTAPASAAGTLNGKYVINSGIAYPDTTFNAGCYFVDFVFEATGGGGSSSNARFLDFFYLD
jgi:hypothetical protein